MEDQKKKKKIKDKELPRLEETRETLQLNASMSLTKLDSSQKWHHVVLILLWSGLFTLP